MNLNVILMFDFFYLFIFYCVGVVPDVFLAHEVGPARLSARTGCSPTELLAG